LRLRLRLGEFKLLREPEEQREVFGQKLAPSYDRLAFSLKKSALSAKKMSLKKKLNEEALLACERAIELHPNDYKFHGRKGTILAQMNRHAEAIFAYEESLERNPIDVTILLHMGQAQTKQEMFDMAIEYIERAVKQAPRDPAPKEHLANVHHRKGVAFIKRNKYDEAIESLMLSTEINPRSGRAWEHLAIAYDLVNDGDNARAAAEKAVELKPDLKTAPGIIEKYGGSPH
jgi:Flp pilus assembly protein TadD